VQAGGCTILAVGDAPVRESPEGYIGAALRHEHGAKSLCLLVLAQKGGSHERAGR
jgi:hypothetical protein